MKKTSYFGGPSAPNLGPSTPIKNRKFPGGYDIDSPKRKLVYTEKEKEADDFEKIKHLVYDYEFIGRRQINNQKPAILKKYNLAYGQIDKSDYIKTESELSTEIEMLDGEQMEFDLEFFPIIPNIVNTLTNFLGKVKIEYQARAINPEATNEILEHKNEQIKTLLISKAMEIYNAQLEQQGITQQAQPDIYQQQMEIFQALPKIQEYHQADFRLDIEDWAGHRLETDKHKHNLKDLERDLFFNKLVCDKPFIHINLLDNDYRFEVIRPELSTYLKSPHSKDVSEGVMFMWYEYNSSVNVVSKWGHKLKEEDIEKLQRFHQTTRFTQWTADRYNKDVPDEMAQVQNYIAFRQMDNYKTAHRGDEYPEYLVETLHMYLQVPRKLHKLTMVGMDGAKVSTIVDETYKVTLKPTYEPGKPKEEAYLIYGEHLEPFYITELWRVVKINLTRDPNPELGEDIWAVLEKYPVQISDPKISKYGSLIPVHGGPQTNEYNSIGSIVDKCKPWQVFHNYLWNRNKQILETELGVFLLINQNAIPGDNMEGSGMVNKLIEWYMTGRDTGILPTTNDLNQAGQSITGLTGGYGQKMDMTRTEEVLQKAKLAEMCKQECYQVLGITPQLLGDISPNETATGITQGIQRSVASVKNLYDEHFLMMEKARQTALEVAKYIAINNGSVEETYLTNDKQRMIFKTSTENFPLYQLGVFTVSDFDETLLLEEIRMLALRDNTMGADALDKIAIMSSPSIGKIRDELKDLQDKRLKQQQQAEQRQQKLEEYRLQQEQRMLDQKLQWDREKHYSELESRENVAEIKVIGSTSFAQNTGLDQLTQLKTQQLKEDSYYQTILQRAQENKLKKEQLSNQKSMNDSQINSKKSIEEERLQVEREKNMTKLKISNNELKIAKENKP